MTTASPPRASLAPAPAPTPTPTGPQIHTYHCICTQLLLATTTPLPSLPRRGGPASATVSSDDTTTTTTPTSDRAFILPLPTRPPTAADAPNAQQDEATAASAAAAVAEGKHYALLLNVQSERKPRIVQRDDGLEKRWGQRCARCRCVVGYMLDWAHFKEGEGEGRSGCRRDVVYLLPGGLVGTEEMARGEGGSGGGEKGKGKGGGV